MGEREKTSDLAIYRALDDKSSPTGLARYHPPLLYTYTHTHTKASKIKKRKTLGKTKRERAPTRDRKEACTIESVRMRKRERKYDSEQEVVSLDAKEKALFRDAGTH